MAGILTKNLSVFVSIECVPDILSTYTIFCSVLCVQATIVSGGPKDSFLLDTLKTLFRLSRVLRYLEMHSKRHYKFLPVRSS